MSPVFPYDASSTVLLPEMIEHANRVLVTWSESHPEAGGRDLSEIAVEWGCTAQEAAERLRPGGAVYFAMDEADARRILAHPESMIGSVTACPMIPTPIRGCGVPFRACWGTTAASWSCSRWSRRCAK